jgi:hypothetical protein
MLEGEGNQSSSIRQDPVKEHQLLISGPQVRSLYDSPIQSTTYVVPAQTLFSIKPVLDLFLEFGRVRFSVLQQRVLSFLTRRGTASHAPMVKQLI